MAQPGEKTPLNPIAPVSYSAPGSAGKRHRDDEVAPPGVGGEDEDLYSAPKRRAKAQDVLFRIVMPSRQIGKVIGKEGCRIRKIREQTKATVKIADAIAVSSRPHRSFRVSYSLCLASEKVWEKKKVIFLLQRHEERVIIISSRDGDNQVSDAENALQQIATLILQVNSSNNFDLLDYYFTLQLY